MSDAQSAVRAAIHESASFDRPFILSNLAATVIASAGLLGNSTATIIGAMLVATLMGPIVGIGLALVDFDSRLLGRTLFALAVGTALVLAIGILLGLLAPQTQATAEMLGRTSAGVLDLIVALASGAICAYAATTPRLSAAIVGVSIAVALVPPLATAGLFIARADWRLAGGAFLLAFVNMVAIQVGTSITLWLRGFRGGGSMGTARTRRLLQRQSISLLLMLALLVTLGFHGVNLIRQQRFEAAVRVAIEGALTARPEAALTDLSFANRDGRPVATAVIRCPVPFTVPEVQAIAQRLPRAPDGAAVTLGVRRVEVEVVGEGR